MSKDFVDELIDRMNASPVFPVSVWLEFAEELIENINTGVVDVSDCLSVGIEDEKIVVSIYSGEEQTVN